MIQRILGSQIASPRFLVPAASVLAVLGPVLTVSGGFWDAVSHLQARPEFFWSEPHVVVYAGVSVTAAGAALGGALLLAGRAPGLGARAVWMVVAGSAVQAAAGFGDYASHEMFGIDGLVSWSHQPLEAGLVLSSLGGALMLRGTPVPCKRALVPFATVSFLFFSVWLAFNLVLVFGHVVQCLPVYGIFSSGCAIM